ncbi:MAG: hypothetical protein HC855_13960 [Rhizobiales bacterium]|nr:hypothetical protein [Hyphomicrobiales bacterium]
MKSLDAKLGLIGKGRYTPKSFILADAKDGDMALGVKANGPIQPGNSSGAHRSRQQHIGSMKAIVRQKQMDIMLGSAGNIELLADNGVFAKSPVTAAIRANDTTDIWHPRGATYATHPSRPFRTANLALVKKFCDLGLYSITLNNDLDRDYTTIETYARFREDAAKLRFRHFLEVFNPNAAQGLSPEQTADFVNDSILRILAGVTKAERPIFLKMVFNGRRATEDLAGSDSSLVIGVLGGSAGTTRDTFELLTQSEKSGARVALFGRKINLAESPLDLVALFRPVLEGAITPENAVKQYHATLLKSDLKPMRRLEDDLRITERNLEGFGK